MADDSARSHAVGMTAIRALRHVTGSLVARLDPSSDRGASAVEYGIMVMLIAAVIIVAVFFLGSTTSSSFSCAAGTVQTQMKIAGCG